MSLRLVHCACAMVLLLIGMAQAQEALPEHRFVYTRDTDFPGGDISSLFDTTQEACERACAADRNCGAFTFNARSNACFPKTGATERQPYTGAMSAIKIATDPFARQAARTRLPQLSFLTSADLEAARNLVTRVARQYPAGDQVPADLTRALAGALARQNIANARVWAAFLASASDASEAWAALSRTGLRLPQSLPQAQRREARRDAVPAAINAVLRARSDASEAEALAQLADAFEVNGRGRDMIPALRRAWQLTGRQDLSDQLDAAISKYGFRIVDQQVDNDSAAPRICATFSEPLVARGVDYDAYVSIPNLQPVVRAEGPQLCVDGVEHGSRYTLTFRAGLPADSGESLARNRRITLYVRDRSPGVRFPGRAYVLPRLEGAALPIETVNTDRVDLRLRAVSDRNLMRTLQEGFFGRPLAKWEDEILASDIGEEVWTGSADVGMDLNRDITTRLPLAEMLADRAPGIYALSAEVPGADPYDSPASTQWFVLSDLGITSLSGGDGLHVAVRGLSDAGGRGGVDVSLISRANAVLAETTTDTDGFARFDASLTRGTGPSAPALIVARTADDLVFLPLTGPAFDLSDRGVEGRAAPGPIDAFLAVDRGAYRPGEVINATALLRDDTSVAMPDLPLVAVLSRPDGAEYSRHTARQSAAGGQVFRLPLGKDIPRGTWRLDLRLGAEGAPLASENILVEDFLPERLDLALTLPEGPLNRAALPALQMQADYLFGAPGGDLAVEAEVRLRPGRTLDDWPGYSFGPYDSSARTRVAYLDATRTDATGRAGLTLRLPNIDAPAMPLTAEIVARVSEGSGRPVERSITRTVAADGPLIGLKPGFEGTLPEGGTAQFDLLALAPDGTPLSGQVSWTLNRVETRYQWYELYGNWNWEPTTRRTRVASGSVTLSDTTQVSAPVTWGTFELVAELDGQPAAFGSVRFEAGWYGAGDSSATPDRLEVALDQEVYATGDTARFRIVSADGGTALVSVMGTDVIHREVVSVPEGGTVVPLAIDADWGTGAYVTATLLRAPDTNDPGPTRAMGLAHARIDPGDKALNVSLEAAETISGQPGAVEVTVRVDGMGTERGYVTLAAVDLGIQNLTGHTAPDPQAHYFGKRRLGVEIRDLYGRLIDGQTGALGQVRSGGDAGASLKFDSPPPTEEPMTFFSGMVPVAADGTARFLVTKPAFNGTIRLDAIAWSPRGVGQDSRDVIARDPVVLTASLPRFMAPGDQSRLLLEFVHADGPAGTFPLAVTAAGVQTGLVPPNVTLSQGGKTVVEVPITALAVGDRTVNVSLILADGQRITKTLNLGVRQNDPEKALTRRFALSPGESFRFDSEVLTGLRRGTGSATLAAGPLARLDVPGLISQLDRNPYGCTEQITSAAMPLLYLSDFAPEQDNRTRIEQAIARVLTRQTASGSFGLWRPSSGDIWLDAYATDFLTRARDRGFDVPEIALEIAIQNLRNQVNYAPDFDRGGEGLAYALLVLAREGAATMADLRYYSDQKGNDFATPRAMAQIGAALASYGDQQRADEMFVRAADRLSAQQAGLRVWRADYGSDVSDAAALLRLASVAGSAAVDRPGLASRLTPQRRLSTQEAAQVLLASDSLRSAPGSAGLEVNGVPAPGPVIQRLDANTGAAAYAVRNIGTTATDVTLTTFGVPEVAPPAGGYGYALSRAYYTPEGAPVVPPVQAGQQMVVVLTITPFEETGARLMVEDPLPAGLEIDNPNLVQSGQIRALEWLKPAPTESAEFLTDRFRAALDVRETEPVRVAYKVRAVSPGNFHHPAAMVHDMYRPEYHAVTDTGRWTVLR